MTEESQAPDTIAPPPPTQDFRFIGEVGPLFDALAKAQADFVPMARDSEVDFKSAKGGRAFKYASLAEVLDSVRPALNKHGLALLQPFNGNEVVTILAHGAARFEVTVVLPEWKGVQELGSALTYIKRYQLKSLLGVNDGEDDDGNAADGTGHVPEPRATAPRPRAEPPAVKSSGTVANGTGQLVTPETIGKVKALAQKAGFKGKGELEEFSQKHGCGPLDGQTEIAALRLYVELERLQVSG